MTNEQKLAKIKMKLNISSTDTSADSKLSDYLDNSAREILSWIYTNKSEIPETVTNVPTKYEMVQINSVIIEYNLEGGEGEVSHSENGISRTFKYSNAIDYIHDHVAQLI